MLRASANSIVVRDLYESVLAHGDGPPNRGAAFHASLTPRATLVTIDGVSLLVDCGWSRDFDVRYLSCLIPVLAKVDAVLLTSSEFASCGAVPIATKFLRTNVPVLATIATSKLAVLAVASQFSARFAGNATFVVPAASAGEAIPTLVLEPDEIYGAFAAVVDGPFGRVSAIGSASSETLTELSVQSFRAGRILGGCGWRVRYQTDDLVFLPNFSIGSTSTLRGVDLQAAAAPNLLVTDAFPASLEPHTEKIDAMERRMVKQVRDDLRRHGTVLFPVDAAGRGIETLLMLERLFETEGLSYPIVFASTKSREMLDRVRTLTEFFIEDILTEEKSRLLPNIIFARTAAEALGDQGPKCIVADGLCLDDSISAQILLSLVNDPSRGHSVVFTEVPPPRTPAGQLYARTDRFQQATTIDTTVHIREALTGDALDAYLDEKEQEEMAAREREEKALAASGHTGGAGEHMMLNTEHIAEDDDAELLFNIDDEAAVSAPSVKVIDNTKMFFPPHLRNFKSKFPLFPPTDNKLEETAYGAPLQDWEIQRMRRVVPLRTFTDNAPDLQNLDDATRVNEKAPATIAEKQLYIGLDSALGVHYYRYDGGLDGEALRQLIKTYFKDVKRIVFGRGTQRDMVSLANYVTQEVFTSGSSSRQKCYCLSAAATAEIEGVAPSSLDVELATAVHSYKVRLESGLAVHAEDGLRQVREGASGNVWSIGWVTGQVAHVEIDDDMEQGADTDGSHIQSRKRQREAQEQKLPFLVVPQHHDAGGTETNLDAGSVFIGAVDVPGLREALAPRPVRQHGSAALACVEGSNFVRLTNPREVTLESVASPAAFQLRRAVYNQFSQVL